MAKDKEEIILDENDVVIEMTDGEGNSYYYVEEMIIPVNGENFALLVAVEPGEEESEHNHGETCDSGKHNHDGMCDCGEDDDSVIIAKIVVNENGEEEYIEPTDEEFEAVLEAYEQMMDEEI